MLFRKFYEGILQCRNCGDRTYDHRGQMTFSLTFPIFWSPLVNCAKYCKIFKIGGIHATCSSCKSFQMLKFQRLMSHGRPVARIVKTRRQTGRAPPPFSPPLPSLPLLCPPLLSSPLPFP